MRLQGIVGKDSSGDLLPDLAIESGIIRRNMLILEASWKDHSNNHELPETFPECFVDYSKNVPVSTIARFLILFFEDNEEAFSE